MGHKPVLVTDASRPLFLAETRCDGSAPRPGISVDHSRKRGLRFNSHLRQNALFFRPYLRRRPTERGVGGLSYSFWYAKSCLRQAAFTGRPCAVIATVGYAHRAPMLEEDGRSGEALPLLRLTPPNYTHLYGVKCTRRVDSQTQHGLPHIHPKMGSTVESRWWVGSG